MTVQTIYGHGYGVVNATTTGAIYSRDENAGGLINFQKPPGTVIYNATGPDRIICNDVLVGFDYYGTLGQTYRLYQALFNRVPDQDGLSNNVALFDNGTVPSLMAMSAAFLVSPEAIATYGNQNPDARATGAFIFALYVNVLHRTPSPAEVNAWIALGYDNKHQVIGFSESPENNTAVNPVIKAGVKMTRSFFGV